MSDYDYAMALVWRILCACWAISVRFGHRWDDRWIGDLNLGPKE